MVPQEIRDFAACSEILTNETVYYFILKTII